MEYTWQTFRCQTVRRRVPRLCTADVCAIKRRIIIAGRRETEGRSGNGAATSNRASLNLFALDYYFTDRFSSRVGSLLERSTSTTNQSLYGLSCWQKTPGNILWKNVEKSERFERNISEH